MATTAEIRNGQSPTGLSDERKALGTGESEYARNPLGYLQLSLLNLIDKSEEKDNFLTSITERISSELDREYSVPHIATTLERIVDKGLCTACTKQYQGKGRAKRYYQINDEGKIALRDSYIAIERQLNLIRGNDNDSSVPAY